MVVTSGATADQKVGAPLVVLDGVNKWFGELHVLKDINLTVARGEVVVVIGPSRRASPRSAGRSTGWRRSTRRQISLDGTPLPQEGRGLAPAGGPEVGMVFHPLIHLGPTRRSSKNVTLGPIRSAGTGGRGRARARER